MTILECLVGLWIATFLVVVVMRYTHVVSSVISKRSQYMEFESEWFHFARQIKTILNQAGQGLCEKIQTDSEWLFDIPDHMTPQNAISFESQRLDVRYVDVHHGEIVTIDPGRRRIHVRGGAHWHAHQHIAIGDCHRIAVVQVDHVSHLSSHLDLIVLTHGLPDFIRSSARVATYHHVQMHLKKKGSRQVLVMDNGFEKNTWMHSIVSMNWIFGEPSRLEFTFQEGDHIWTRWIDYASS